MRKSFFGALFFVIGTMFVCTIISAAAIVVTHAQGFPQIATGNGSAKGTVIFPSADPTTGLYFGTGRVGIAKHLESGVPAAGNVPVLSACGTATAGDAGSTDTAGTVTQGGTVTTCTITFGTAYTVAPTCFVQDLTGTRASMGTAVSATAIAVTGVTASDKLAWFCVAKSGG